jgi:hypothetical protein
MALPTLVKDYEVVTNQAVAADNTIDAGTNAHRDRRNLLLNIKDQMIAAGTSNVGTTTGGSITAWTVTQSCNGTAVNSSGDNWSTNTDLQWDTSGNTHSWIVLQQTGISSNFQVCFDLVQNNNTDDGGGIGCYVAPAGYNTDGTTSSRPTPSTTDGELALRVGALWGGGSTGGAGRAFSWNMWRSEDGEVTWVVIFYADNPVGCWMFCSPQNPSSGWSGVQFVASVLGEDDGLQTTNINDWYDTPALRTWRSNRISTADSFNITELYMSCDTFGGGPISEVLTVANQISGEYALSPVGLVCIDPGFTGRMGTMYDLYWGQDALGNPVDNYPSGGSKTFIQIGELVFPWDGSTPVTS